MIEIVSATRGTSQLFWQDSPLGRSLLRLKGDGRFVPHVFFENSAPLANAYNSRIQASEADVLVFIHDDVWIDDLFFCDHLMSGLAVFDVIGVAGNRRRVAQQPAWAFVDTSFKWDDKNNLSGAIGHGSGPWGELSFFGRVPAQCELLDGVFLAAERRTLREAGVLFDSRFDFHLYDMDFCRSARKKDLCLGTWPIALTHRSGGAFGGPEWARNWALYQRKWGD